MDLSEAMYARHSVRKYLDKPIEGIVLETMLKEIQQINDTSGLSIQLILNEPKAFGSIIATYGMLKNVRNYIALVGKDDKSLNENVGYYGEQLVLLAQQIGLNTCWVAGTYKKSAVACDIRPDEKLACVIAIGYGATSGRPHRNRPIRDLYVCQEEMPEWFEKGLQAALTAPTAINQQKFRFILTGPQLVKAEATGGFYSDIDLGIVKYHFEIGAGKHSFSWA